MKQDARQVGIQIADNLDVISIGLSLIELEYGFDLLVEAARRHFQITQTRKP